MNIIVTDSLFNIMSISWSKLSKKPKVSRNLDKLATSCLLQESQVNRNLRVMSSYTGVLSHKKFLPNKIFKDFKDFVCVFSEQTYWWKG